MINMPTTLADIEVRARKKLAEITPKFWASNELQDDIVSCIKDLWRDTVDLKQEHYFIRNNNDVTYLASSDHLAGLPSNIHKVYLIEARDTSSDSANAGLLFKPKDYNHEDVQLARSRDAIDPSNDTIYYSITSEGGPVGAPVIYCAPQVNSTVNISFCYIPTFGPFAPDDPVPIPGEADNALVAWTVAYARAKEREDRAPDPSWLAIYSTEKGHLLQSLSVRQVQEPQYVDALFASYW